MWLKLLSSLIQERRISECQTILCLVAHVLVPCRPIWKQQQMQDQQKGSSKRKINFLLRTTQPSPVLILIRFSEAASAFDSRGKVCSYTNHFSSGEYRFNDKIQWVQSMGQRERYIMGKARLIMEDHKAISITLTSALKPLLRIPNTPRGTGQCLNLSHLFSRQSLHPLLYSWPARSI